MKFKSLLLFGSVFLGCVTKTLSQTTTCPAPIPGDANCFQTSRPSAGNPLTNWPPIPNQDCCNAIPLCQPLNFIDNGIVVPEGAPAGTLYPGCVQNELPPTANTCFSNNEKATTWYKWQIRPLIGGPTAVGSPAGKLRFKIIPLDALEDPDYDPSTDLGAIGYGDTDYDFLLFKVTGQASNDGAACTKIRNSTIITDPNTAIASCNWTGTRGPTGLFEPGTGTANAQGPATRFNKPLNVKVGDVFYLAVDNFSINQQGFYVDFRGLEAPDDSTAIVNPPATDTIRIASIVNPVCASNQFVLKFDHPVRCDSVRGDKFIVQGLNPPYQITSMAPQGGCNPGGQDTAFVFTIVPFLPDTTLRLLLTNTIKDICGNQVLLDTANLRVEYPVPLVYGITGSQPSCGITEITIQFAKKVYCDSVKANKFIILNNGLPFGQVVSTRRANNQPCNSTTLDSLYVIRFSNAIKDSTNLQLVLGGIVKDFCGNPVKGDTIKFRINPFLTASADFNTVCPKKPAVLTAILDSTFKNIPLDSLEIKWYNLNTNQQLESDGDTIVFNPFDSRKISVKRDLFFPELVNYRVVVRNLKNGCLDTATVPVLFSAKPDLAQPNKLTYCFGDDFTYKPLINNAKRDQLVYSWFRGPGRGALDTLTRDSVFSQSVDSLLLTKGVEQNYELDVKYIDSLGGCKAEPFKFAIRYGRKISPKIDLDPGLRYASITPADFVFGNASTFTPPKVNSLYNWDFGQGDKKSIFGPAEATTTYLEAALNGAGYVVSLTAFDTLYASADQIGKVCTNTDTITVYVQNLLPSLVTADGDGLNDNFYIKGMREGSFTMKLYNRWGKLVAEQDPFKVNLSDEGRGGLDVKDIGPGIYYYILTEKRSGKTLVSWLTITKQK